MAEYLLEIGMEEMPAAYMNGAVSDLKKNAQALFRRRFQIGSCSARQLLFPYTLALLSPVFSCHHMKA